MTTAVCNVLHLNICVLQGVAWWFLCHFVLTHFILAAALKGNCVQTHMLKRKKVLRKIFKHLPLHSFYILYLTPINVMWKPECFCSIGQISLRLVRCSLLHGRALEPCSSLLFIYAFINIYIYFVREQKQEIGKSGAVERLMRE